MNIQPPNVEVRPTTLKLLYQNFNKDHNLKDWLSKKRTHGSLEEPAHPWIWVGHWLSKYGLLVAAQRCSILNKERPNVVLLKTYNVLIGSYG